MSQEYEAWMFERVWQAGLILLGTFGVWLLVYYHPVG